MRRTTIIFLLPFLLAIFVSTVFSINLDAPAEKNITVRSEIIRGHDSISNVAYASSLDFIDMIDLINAVFHRNQQFNTDTDGFLLGAHFASWFGLQMHLKLLEGRISSNTHELALLEATSHFKSFRDLQSKLKIDDELLIKNVLKMNYPSVRGDLYRWNKLRDR